ncbi:type II secretion system protein GspF [Paraphotobacterium marinum]|uniref:Type II secretion system protein GspF n=1 Tax=Paraphotobacterium marinum TaxID=1755811 RepID=A0A220VCS8_9GAMM|nr:type II secretion system F family protein [Paraphotobacterium marinum]ASK78194.1 type II secretion system protein GspF [Paraphotobacterium marinum]
MTLYKYEAINADGQTEKGEINAGTKSEVSLILKEQHKILVSLSPKAAYKKISFFKYKISIKDLSLFTRQLATLIQANISVDESLSTIAEQTQKERLSKILIKVRDGVREGNTLSKTMNQFPNVFDSLYVSMIASGEKSSKLGGVLESLATYIEKKNKLKSVTTQAMVYPVVLLVVSIIITLFLLVSVVPPIIEQFSGINKSLPLVTVILISISSFIINYGLFIAVLLIFFYLIFRLWIKKDYAKLWLHRVYLKIPIVGKIIVNLNSSRFARTLAISMQSSIPLLEGITLAKNVVTNKFLNDKINKVYDNVKEGVSLYISLKNINMFSPIMLYMISSGEKSGELVQMLNKAADYQDQYFESVVNVALKIFEPLLIILMAGIVMFIVVAILLPIIELNNFV